MAVKGLVVAVSAACMLAQFQARAAAQLPTQVPTEVPTELKPQLNAELPTEAQARAVGTKVVVEGCVERAQRDGSLGGTGLNTTSTPNTAARDANSSEPVDAFLLSSAHRVPREPSEGMDRTSYALQGLEQNMGAHSGHRVRITGMLLPQPRPTGSAAAAASGIRRIRVEEVTLVSITCDGDRLR